MRTSWQIITVLSAALAVTSLWLLRPERRDATPTPAVSVMDLSSSSPASVPAEPAGAAPALASGDRLELVRRCLRLAETDPLAAMDLAIAQKLADDDRGLLTTLILRWAAQDFSGALEWARVQPDDADRDEILAHLAYLRSQSQPSVAAEIAAAEISDPRARAEAIISVVHQWALSSPSDAQSWADRLTDPKLRDHAMEEIVAVRTQHASHLVVGNAVR